MKALLRRNKGVIWRTFLTVPFSLILSGLSFILRMILKCVDLLAGYIVKEWKKLNQHLEDAPNALTQIAWIILYLPFIILSLVSLILILYPVWYILKPIFNKTCDFNINMLTWVQYRPARADEAHIVDEALTTLKEKLKAEGLTETQLDQMFPKS